MYAICFFLTCLLAFENCVVWGLRERNSHWTSPQDEEFLPNGDDFPYWTYLLTPRLHFSGTFKADVSTVNNIYESFDTENYDPHNERLQGFNSHGTGAWMVTGRVRQVCYLNGACLRDYTDRIWDEPIQEDSNTTSAKMVDLDTQAQLYSEMWGWRIRIGNHFSADFTTTPLQYIWAKMSSGVKGSDGTSGAAYQSTLTNIRWMSNKSKFVRELREMMTRDNIDSDKLSIRFNLDMFDRQQYGRIVGSIGLHGIKSPPFYIQGRYLKPQTTTAQTTQFMLDERNHRVTIDFGNALQITEAGSFNTDNSQIYVAASLDNNSTVTCNSKVFWLGRVDNNNPDWYINSSGIQSFPPIGSLSVEEMDTIKNHSIAVMQVKGIWPRISCTKVLLAEPAHGLDIHPYSKWSLRKNPPEEAEFKVFATKFGKPLKDVVVKFEQNCPLTYPNVCRPPMPYPTTAITDQDGIARFVVRTQDPKNPRGYIDGQLYHYAYYIEGLRPNYEAMHNSQRGAYNYFTFLFTIRVFDHYVAHSPPTWLDDVYPIFLQYANLYPVMTRNFVNLGNYYDVLKQRQNILMSMKLPITHPNYMPVTRDLSESKRKMIIEWLSRDTLLIGKPEDYYTLENLRKNLQTALQIEMATIPPYMTALATIKESRNNEVKNILTTIFVQEMIHMTLVANILNAVGGKPVLNKNVAAMFPTRLPGGVHPELVVPIEKLSIGLIQNIFMKIEEPEREAERHYEFKHTFDFAKRMDNAKSDRENRRRRSPVPDPIVDDEFLPCLAFRTKESLQKDLTDSQIEEMIPGKGLFEIPKKSHNDYTSRRFPSLNDDKGGVKHYNTIGGFYKHILNVLCYLTYCGKSDSIFTGDPSRQVDYTHGSMHGESFKVTDFFSAVKAIQTIVEQGEGSSLCNPTFWFNGSSSDLSHYYLFNSIVEKRQIQVINDKDKRRTNEDIGEDKSTEFCGGKYSYRGPRIHFDPDGVWPMLPNPKMSKYKKGSPAYRKANEFNSVYARLLQSLERMFNGYPDDLKDSIGLMYSALIHLKKLVREPIEEGGDPDVGPNAGPTFEFQDD